ncbi:hypothetical protein OMP40_32605 [Cohnella rhizosphaerae]|uniref:histidine kinase n=2 Tax=Cohnella rhizosphaerae TaxID=1457232 RepID=A0A9X4L498_9BACL|nr:histidine kinase dimerization/phospho-acceptor domain-containing protein [Cohnella rhizosphaerae]MDG0813504.1 hypothetical protein [Cohnella rhizosphaerae]
MVHIRRIRERIETDPGNPKQLLTVRGAWLQAGEGDAGAMRMQHRMAFHFTYQLIFYALLIVTISLVAFILFFQNMSNKELRRNFPVGALQLIAQEAQFKDGTIEISPKWNKLIEQNGMWLQVVGAGGEVIYAVNTTSSPDLPTSYATAQLLDIQETRAFGTYAVHTELNFTFKEPLLYMLGYRSSELNQLHAWFDAYGQHGTVRSDAIPVLDRILNANGSYLQIIDAGSHTLQAIGDKAFAQKAYRPLDILAIAQSPSNYDTKIVAHKDNPSGMTWILYTPNPSGGPLKHPVLGTTTRELVWFAALILLLALSISVWHGYRYGQPLILFAGWFERMDRGQYDQVLTAKDLPKVFRRSGKLRIRYRLYKEVIESFYRMTHQLAQAEKERIRLEKAQTEWMSGISHDLRTPLATIQGYGYMLESLPTQWSHEEMRIMGATIREKGGLYARADLRLFFDSSAQTRKIDHGAPGDGFGRTRASLRTKVCQRRHDVRISISLRWERASHPGKGR